MWLKILSRGASRRSWYPCFHLPIGQPSLEFRFFEFATARCSWEILVFAELGFFRETGAAESAAAFSSQKRTPPENGPALSFVLFPRSPRKKSRPSSFSLRIPGQELASQPAPVAELVGKERSWAVSTWLLGIRFLRFSDPVSWVSGVQIPTIKGSFAFQGVLVGFSGFQSPSRKGSFAFQILLVGLAVSKFPL